MIKNILETLSPETLAELREYFNRAEGHLVKLNNGKWLAVNFEQIENFKPTHIEGYWAIGDYEK